MSENTGWQEGQHVPYDGWYNGNVAMMIANGTFEDFRPKIVRRVEKGFYSDKGTTEERVAASQKKLAQWDEQWKAIAPEERARRRDVVADDVEPKEVVVNTARGPRKVIKSRPSNNNNLDRRRKKDGTKPARRLPPGFITKRPAAARSAQQGAPVGQNSASPEIVS